jgi:hypothetical protein
LEILCLKGSALGENQMKLPDTYKSTVGTSVVWSISTLAFCYVAWVLGLAAGSAQVASNTTASQSRLSSKRFKSSLTEAVFDLGDPGSFKNGKVYIKDIDWDGLGDGLLYYLRDHGDKSIKEIVIELPEEVK